VDAVEYKRLEVSSPGIDRPLRHEQDLQRFAGSVVDIDAQGAHGWLRRLGRSARCARNFAAR
jgi:ribosome maturation factor RimP